jgi:predicted unusual protein kinase regulating ubiquinone biosynthesis (AarF/ABC1/UbiB family)
MLDIALKARHLGRYRELVRLFYKYARHELRREKAARGDGESADSPAPAAGEPAELADDLERLGPTFIKLGQLLSTRPDLLPAPYTDALARLQDRVEPFPFEEVQRIVESDLGVRLHKLFLDFDPQPLAAASLAQTHRARLRDGRPVAVKVQRPGVRPKMVGDLAATEEAAAFLERHSSLVRRLDLRVVIEELRRDLLRELDFVGEARNLRELAENLRGFERIVVPAPHEDFTGARVLTMDLVSGSNLMKLSPLFLTEVDGPGLAGQLFRAYLKQILVDGFFHADPHPGNVLLTDDHRIALVDLGMTARLSPVVQEDLLSLLLAIVDGRSEAAADIAVTFGTALEGFQEASFRRQIARLVLAHRDADISRIDTGRVILAISRAARETGLRLPERIALLGKTLLNLDRVVFVLDPHFDPNAAVRQEAGALVRARLQRGLTQSRLFAGLIELRQFAEKLPDRLGRILDIVGDNRLELRVKALDERMLIAGFQKVANRIALGVVLGCLIIGAALLMRVETRFRLFGYPGLAILLFLTAAAGGIWLALDILFRDENRPPGPRPR